LRVRIKFNVFFKDKTSSVRGREGRGTWGAKEVVKKF